MCGRIRRREMYALSSLCECQRDGGGNRRLADTAFAHRENDLPPMSRQIINKIGQPMAFSCPNGRLRVLQMIRPQHIPHMCDARDIVGPQWNLIRVHAAQAFRHLCERLPLLLIERRRNRIVSRRRYGIEDEYLAQDAQPSQFLSRTLRFFQRRFFQPRYEQQRRLASVRQGADSRLIELSFVRQSGELSEAGSSMLALLDEAAPGGR